MKKILILFAIIVFIGYIAVNLLTLVKFPIVWRDEAMLSQPAWQFLKTGNFSSNSFGELYDLEKIDSYPGRIHFIFLAIAFKIFGCGIYQARFISFLSGLLAALFTYLIGKKIFNNKIAISGMVLFILSPQFLFASHMARQEIILTLFMLMAIYIYLLAKDRNLFFLFFLSGLISSFSLDIHLNGVMIPIILIVLFLFDIKEKKVKGVSFFYYLVGIFLGGIFLAIPRFLTDISILLKQWKIFFSDFLIGTFNPPIFSNKNLFELLSWEVERYRYIHIFELIIIIVALIFSIKKRLGNKRILLTAVCTLISVFTFLISHKSSFYIIYLYPFFMLYIASFSYLSKSRIKIVLARVMILMLMLFYIFQDAAILYKSKDRDYYGYLNRIKNFVKPGSIIAGQPTWWYGFYDEHKYYALAAINLSGLYIPTVMEKKRIQYLLVDEYWRQNFPEGMEEFLERSCERIAELRDKFYGAESFYPSSSYYKLDIYRIKNKL